MDLEDRPREAAPPQQPRPAKAMCCVYWCRQPAVIVVTLDGGTRVGCCRIHAAFIKAGRMDWFDR